MSVRDALEEALRAGAVLVVKADGLRPERRYTVVLSGGPLGDDPFRRDGDDLDALVDDALTRLRARRR